LAPDTRVILFSEITVPMKEVPDAIVVLSPTCQNTLHAWAFPQPESGSTEAYVGTQTALTATAIASRAGVPSTGGAPLQGDGTIWFILGFSGLSVAILFFLTRKIKRNNGSK